MKRLVLLFTALIAVICLTSPPALAEGASPGGVIDFASMTEDADMMASEGWSWKKSSGTLTLSGASLNGIILPDGSGIVLRSTSAIGSGGISAGNVTVDGTDSSRLDVSGKVKTRVLDINSGTLTVTGGLDVWRMDINGGLSYKISENGKLRTLSGVQLKDVGFLEVGKTYTLTGGKNVTGTGTFFFGDKISLSAPAGFDLWYVNNPASLTPANGGSLKFDMPAQNVFVCTLTMKTEGAGKARFKSASSKRIAISATPLEGESFSGWSGENAKFVSKKNADTYLSAPTDSVTVTATFTGGTEVKFVAEKGGEIKTQSGYFSPGEKIRIEAVCARDWDFSTWSADAGSFDDPKSLTTYFTVPEKGVTVKAYFAKGQYELKVVLSNSAGGTLSTEGGKFLPGELIPLSVTLNEDWVFNTWGAPEGDFIARKSPSTGFRMPAANVEVVAFLDNLNDKDHLFVETSAGGKAVLDGSTEITDAKPLKQKRASGSRIKITAIPDEGSVFLGWTGSYTLLNKEGETLPFKVLDDGRTVEYTMTTRSVSFTASFAPASNTLDVYAATGGSATFTDPDPSQGSILKRYVSVGKKLTLIATPERGWHFDKWEIKELSEGVDPAFVIPDPNSATTELTMPNGYVKVTALFLPDDPSMTSPSNENGGGETDPNDPYGDGEDGGDGGENEGINPVTLAWAAIAAAAGVAAVIWREKRKNTAKAVPFKDIFDKYGANSDSERTEVRKYMEKTAKNKKSEDKK